MNTKELENAARTVGKYLGMALIVVAALELAKFNVPYVPGEWWQIAIGGMAIKSI